MTTRKRARKQTEAARRLLRSTRNTPEASHDRTTRFLCKWLEVVSRRAMAGEWENLRKDGKGEQVLTLYRRTYSALQLTACGLPPIDLSGALPPQQVEALATAA